MLCFGGCFAVYSVGLSGGIGLFWSSDVSVELKNYGRCHIDVLVSNKIPGSPNWRFTGFYGSPRAEDRNDSWRLFRTLYNVPHAAWMCMGDFNETMFSNEHFSRSVRPERQMQAF